MPTDEAFSAEPLHARRVVSGLSDEEVVERVRAGDVGLFEVLMRRYNQRLYRAARAILGDDAEAEDVMQAAYVRAYAHLDQFAGRASFAAWLTKIAVHDALARARHRRRIEPVGTFEDNGDGMATALRSPMNVEQQAADHELRAVLEEAITALPTPFRTVFMLRDVEELSTAETAAVLETNEQTVKTRLHRARALLRKALYKRAGAASTAAFQFGFARCDRVVAGVLAKLAAARRH